MKKTWSAPKFSAPLKKVILIFILTFIAGYIDLPHEVPIDLKIGPIKINRKLDLVLGLDLAGGSHLAFEADTTNIDDEKKSVAISGVRDVIERRVNLFGISEPNVQTSSFEGKDRIIVELPGVKDTKEAINLIGQTAQLIFAETGTEEEPGLYPTDLTGAELKSSDVAFDQTTGKPMVTLEFTPEGGQKFSDLTAKNIGKPLAIILDTQVISAPLVQDQITGGSAQITGDFSLEEAKRLSIQLNAGALPGLIGLSMVLVFMVLAYGKLGLIADMALVVFGILTLALYKLIPVVLTLPGIAGFLLSVGMAVDSNILIFERFKEERGRRQFSDALEVAFGRAWDSIRDANIATLAAAFVLANPLDWNFLHTSGPVRGFAMTLSLGILISLFTGIIVSRNLLRVFIKNSAKNKAHSA
jgi:preprotein translocase subunit SecD